MDIDMYMQTCTNVLHEDVRDTHVQNVNRNALKVAIECMSVRVRVRFMRFGHTSNKEYGKKEEQVNERRKWRAE